MGYDRVYCTRYAGGSNPRAVPAVTLSHPLHLQVKNEFRVFLLDFEVSRNRGTRKQKTFTADNVHPFDT